jgi:hypothetical protein
MPPVDTFEEKGNEEHEVKEVNYPEEACLGAVYQCGKITPGRVFNAGSN